MPGIKAFVKREITLCIAFAAAAFSCLLVPPDAAYAGYIDCRTLALLYSLMVVVAGLRAAGVFDALAHWLCVRARTGRTLGLVLVALCFFTSMLITNDVALLTFVPLAVTVLGLAGRSRELAWVVVLQTVAANLGSMLTPVGNPQNLYLYSYYGMDAADFFSATAPVWLASAVVLAVLCLALPVEPVSISMDACPRCQRGKLLFYGALFCLCMLVVLRVIPWPYMLLILLAALLVYDRRMLLKADFFLLLTFICFFIFAGNLARIGAVNRLLRTLLSGREMLVGAGLSQIISNVPAAILLSAFTDRAKALLLGVNIGGLGTPIASLASLISMKLYSSSPQAAPGRFMKLFLAVNFPLLALLLLLGWVMV